MITVAVVTVSDSAAAATREDLSGPAVRVRCEELGWTVVHTQIVPDEVEAIAAALAAGIRERQVDLVLTTGGTGVAARDVTPEATRSVITRELPGLGELMRSEGLKQTRFSVLSRAVAGTAGQTLIINLPGSPKGAVASLNSVAGLVPHIVDLLRGQTEHPPG